MGQFDKFSSKEFINGIVKLSEMIDEALLITDNKGLIMMANDVALESFGKHILGRTVVEVVDDLDLSKMFGETTLQSIEQEVSFKPKADSVHREYKLKVRSLEDGLVRCLAAHSFSILSGGMACMLKNARLMCISAAYAKPLTNRTARLKCLI